MPVVHVMAGRGSIAQSQCVGATTLSPDLSSSIVTAFGCDSSEENQQMELGTVADWVAAVGTAGTLIATTFIILDNQSRSRRAPAEAVSVWFTQRFSLASSGQGTHTLDVHLFNGSSSPIPSATVYSRIPGRDYIEESMSSSTAKIEAIQPGASLMHEIPVVHHVDVDRVFVFFIARDGQRWARRLGDGRLFKGIRARHLADGASAWRAAFSRSYPRG